MNEIGRDAENGLFLPGKGDDIPLVNVGLTKHEAGIQDGDIGYATGRAASHTRSANSGAVGLAVDCMAGAVERPFDPGKSPMTAAHVDGLVKETARLCRKFWIPATRWQVLSHAEVQATLGIRKRFKWDITWLPGMARPGDPIEVGDWLRAMVREKMGL